MIINKQLIIYPGEKMSLQEQHKVLERIFVEQLKPIKWLTITDKFRKDIPMKIRNMKFENFKNILKKNFFQRIYIKPLEGNKYEIRLLQNMLVV